MDEGIPDGGQGAHGERGEGSCPPATQGTYMNVNGTMATFMATACVYIRDPREKKTRTQSSEKEKQKNEIL